VLSLHHGWYLSDFLFAPPVATLVAFEQAGRLESHMALVISAIKYCAASGLTGQLAEELEAADIDGQYVSYVRLAPWKRHSATDLLQRICATFRVSVFRSSISLHIN